ncbi:hypothetical protein PIB30_050135 [Stylosanthes scabra]|uniref:K+ potassium transporter integral membrane domain-containing protein n=1 Tax=Stylosanthes scabra TaxID=79078 RepID=A0ABU6VGE8_9FABA|nr:hypothetical protein [Stylosanthes scabra]
MNNYCTISRGDGVGFEFLIKPYHPSLPLLVPVLRLRQCLLILWSFKSEVYSVSAAIVASQSLIYAAFSIIKQSVVLDYFPFGISRDSMHKRRATGSKKVWRKKREYYCFIFFMSPVFLNFSYGILNTP